ncbi:glutathione peroxidase [Caldibacillus thermoamylovorans]|uniref:glutathione peroxidase n=1 Tax=Caldibacillus thermoamylovorans TaxID=35841 RepID=UPI001D0626B2|nr:glutathione peroxidase [Caldibacillus thermoamylovorans]MCB5936576.1 glutathione peroxidase [Bacillus sp. DFI.2.34]MCB7078058.1 glutathione peroxidase [Caldibacillus thermoamylovorans]
MKTVYDYTVKKTNGDEQSLKNFEGKVLLIVNTASKCGLTPQFKDLQELYNKYKDQGFEILGFPCSQFNNQEFDNIEETTQFCQVNYGVTFPMFAKIDVNGENADPLFTYLKEQKGGVLSKDIKWNFTKFLVNRNGQVVERYAPTTTPGKIQKDIIQQLSLQETHHKPFHE